MIVALSSVSMMENEQRETQRAEQTKVTHLQNSFEREKGRADLLKSDVDRLEAELRDERRTRRVREQRLEAQAASLQKQVDSNDEVTLRLKEAKERTNSRLEQEASRAQELEKRLKMAQNEASVKSEKISQLQEQLASALSSEMELTYEDLQKLILAQKNAEEISSTIMAIMNKTRSILSNKVTDSSNQLTAPQNTQGPSQVEQVTLNSQTPTRLPERKAAIEGTKRTPVVVPPGMPLESDASLRTVFTQQDLVILIDGYNVSLNSFGNLSLELQRDRIVACATSVEARFHPSCLVVFDGQSSGTRTNTIESACSLFSVRCHS
jgi:Fe2+ transport system protein B